MTTRWPEVELGEVAEFVRGVTFKPAQVMTLGEPGSIACMRTSNVQEQLDLKDVWAVPRSVMRRPEQELRPGDVLISSANSWNLVGKCSWVGDLPWPATFGGFVTSMRPRSSLLEPRYLYRWFSWPRTQFRVRSFGRKTTNISNLSLDQCRRMPFPLPPVEEQQRIVAMLDRTDEVRAKRRTSATLVDLLTTSIFVEMFGDPTINPKHWAQRPFFDVCPTRLGKMLDQKQQSGHSRRPYLRNANVQWFRFELDDLAEMDFSEKDRAEFRVTAGDVLICEGGEPGRAAVWDGSVEEVYFQKAIHRGRPDPRSVTANYVVHLLYQLARRGGLIDHISTATIAHLTGERLKAMRIPVPPIEVQHEFDHRLRAVSTYQNSASSSALELDSLFTGLQDRAFLGAP